MYTLQIKINIMTPKDVKDVNIQKKNKKERQRRKDKGKG